MTLDLRGGNTISQAHKEWFIASLLAAQKWRRDLIRHWTTSPFGSEIRWINGKQYWGGRFNMNHLREADDMVRMATLLGMDDSAKDEVYAIGLSGDTDWVWGKFQINSKTTDPFGVDNFSFMIEHGVATHAKNSGLDTITFKSRNVKVPCVYIGGLLDDPYNHAPLPLNMVGMVNMSEDYHPNFSSSNTFQYYDPEAISPTYNTFYNTGLAEAFSALYCMGVFANRLHTKAVHHVDTTHNALTQRAEYWVFQTWDVVEMGDYGWMDDEYARNILYPIVKIGSSRDIDYFDFYTVNQFKGRSSTSAIAKNLSGLVMEIIDGDTSGNNTINSMMFTINRSPYDWAIVDGDTLWFEYEYTMNMEIKEFAYLISSHFTIEAGANKKGFFGSFFGGFIGAILGLVQGILNVFFKVVEMLDIVMKPMIKVVLKHIFGVKGDRLEKIMNAYTEIRNQIALIVVTLGVGAYLEGASIAAEASAAMEAGGGAALTAAETEMVIAGSIEASFATIGGMELAGYGLQIGMAGFNGLNAIDPSASAATASAVEESARSANPMQLVYGDRDIDLIDAWYATISDPMMIMEMENDLISQIYS